MLGVKYLSIIFGMSQKSPQYIIMKKCKLWLKAHI